MPEMNRNGRLELKTDEPVDVAIVGGGAAGLSAALTISRALRRVVVIDSGKPRNAVALHMHGYLGYDGVPPQELLERGRAEIESYGATFLEDTVTEAESARDSEGTMFRLALGGGSQVTARRLLFAGGSTDVLPDISGLEELWGNDVHACPYCHGYEVRNEPLAVIATGEHSIQYALMIRHWSPDMIYFDNDQIRPNEEQEAQFEALGIRWVAGAVMRLISNEGRLQAVELESGETYDRSAAFLASHLSPNSFLLESLGAAIQDTPQGRVVEVDPQGRTSVTGVWAAGNVTNPSIQVIGAAAAGNLAGASINMDLIQEDQRPIVSAVGLRGRQVG